MRAPRVLNRDMETDFRPVFIADWMDVAFVHFRVNPNERQPLVPFALDLLDGEAFVSIVAFTQRRLRPAIGGRIAALLATRRVDVRSAGQPTLLREQDALDEAGVDLTALEVAVVHDL
jgi:uncharacterized protein YqjF (DUF2071 family)